MVAVVETKEIGISLGVGKGKFYNTEYTSNSIRLLEIGQTNDGEPVYIDEGYWESEIIDLVGKFKEYDKVVLAKSQEGNSNYAILTRTSDDGTNFSEYIATTPEGRIQSEAKRYIQIKIVLYAGFVSDTLTISSFDIESELDKWSKNDFVESNNGLKLKKNYMFSMSKDNSWNEEGSLHRKIIKIDDWKRVDSLLIE